MITDMTVFWFYRHGTAIAKVHPVHVMNTELTPYISGDLSINYSNVILKKCHHHHVFML